MAYHTWILIKKIMRIEIYHQVIYDFPFPPLKTLLPKSHLLSLIHSPHETNTLGKLGLTLSLSLADLLGDEEKKMFRTRDLLTIDVYSKGIFCPKPLVYFNPIKIPVSGADFRNMEFNDFLLQLRRLTGVSSGNFYYCDSSRSLVDGLRELTDSDDYVRFLDAGYFGDKKVNIYIDEQNEPIMEWIDEERAEEGCTDDEVEWEDDVDSVMSDAISVDHEVDDEVIQIKQSADPFLSKTKQEE